LFEPLVTDGRAAGRAAGRADAGFVRRVAKIVAGLVVFVPYFGVAIVREVVLHPQLILDSFLHSFVTALLPPLGFVILQCILPVTCMVYMCSRRALLWIEDTVWDPMLAPVEFRIWQVTCKTVATTTAVWRRRTWRRVSEKLSLWGAFWYTVCTHKHRHPPAPCEQGFSPENVACLSVLGQKKTEKGVAVFMRAYGNSLPTGSEFHVKIHFFFTGTAVESS
jgi:hypothetical protein